MLVAAVLAAVYLIWSPYSPDLAAQTFRADIFSAHGYLLWNNDWYAGHYLLGYSLTYPPLGALLGPRLLGALAAVAAAGLFGALARHRFGDRARVATLWFGAATVTNLLTGRITFALGVAVGLGALLALQRRRPVLAPALGVLTAFSSPVAALFVALAAAAVARGEWRRPAATLALATLAAALALSVAFPTAGYFPFVLSAFLPIPLLGLGVLALTPAGEDWLRRATLLYLAVSLLFAIAHTPVGANAARLGALFGGPVVALVLAERRRWILALLAIPLIYWQWVSPVRDVSDARGDASVHASYYEPLLGELNSLHPGPVRIEVPPTRDRWESAYIAPHYALQRGWLRQLESDDFSLFQNGNLAPASYHAWLDEHAISYVALPDVQSDYLAEDEAELIRGGLPYLQPVWRNENWSLYRVKDATPIAGPAGARLTGLGPADFSLDAEQAGAFLVRIHYTPYWTVTAGDACVSRSGDWTLVRAAGPGEVSVAARFSIGGLLHRERTECSG